VSFIYSALMYWVILLFPVLYLDTREDKTGLLPGLAELRSKANKSNSHIVIRG
jgi:hypothetical protein